jgi:hypothetical protein
MKKYHFVSSFVFYKTSRKFAPSKKLHITTINDEKPLILVIDMNIHNIV